MSSLAPPTPMPDIVPFSRTLISPKSINAELQHHQKGCSIRMMLLLSGPRLALQMAWSAQWAGLGPYLSNLLPDWAVMITQIIGPVTGILVAPTVGVLSDTCTSRFGRRRPFLFVGALTSIICWTLMGFTKTFGVMMGDNEEDRTWTAIFAVLFYMWMDITVNIVQTPSQLIIADFVGDRQTTGAAIGQATSTFGSLLIAGYIAIFGPASESLPYFLGMLSVFMFVTVGVVCLFATETPFVSVDKAMTVKSAFSSIWTGIRTLPHQLAVFAMIFFCVQYGYTSYNGAKGQFFGTIVFDGDGTNADKCGNDCSLAQLNFQKGVQMAAGWTDIFFNSGGYLFSWILPLLVARFGIKNVLQIALVPQMLLMVMAFSTSVGVNIAIVVLTCITQNTAFAMMVPIIVHEIGGAEDSRLGMYVGALNSANCGGQFLNFLVAAALVNTSMGYALPIFVGGAVSLIGGLICAVSFKVHTKVL